MRSCMPSLAAVILRDCLSLHSLNRLELSVSLLMVTTCDEAGTVTVLVKLKRPQCCIRRTDRYYKLLVTPSESTFMDLCAT